MTTNLKEYTAEFFITKKGKPGGLGFYDHFLAENIERALDQVKTYLKIFDETHDYTISRLYEGWDVLSSICENDS